LLLASGLLAGCSHGQAPEKAPSVLPRPAGVATVPTAPSDPGPELLEGGGEAAVLAAVQQAIVLPWGAPVPAPSSRVVVRFIVGTVGEVAEEKIVQGLGPAVDEAVLAAVRALPRFRPVQRAGKYVRVPYVLAIAALGVATPAQRREADTRGRQTAQRLPGEADSTFVRRVLPLSYADNLLAYAWRPGAYGKQLFFSQRGGEDNQGGTDLYVLDPYRPGTYAVQVLPIETMGDLTDLAAFFFADATRDGRPDLLALAECSLREAFEVDGERMTGRANHYETRVWQYAGVDKAGPSTGRT
ncbi:MAG TPA: energy transducer TonB, partial [Hymenobacter sp.]